MGGRGYLSVEGLIMFAEKWCQSMQRMHIKHTFHVKERHCYAIFVEDLSVNNFRFGCK